MHLNIRKTKQPDQKTGGRPKQTYLQRGHTGGQQTHEKDAQHPSLLETCKSK